MGSFGSETVSASLAKPRRVSSDGGTQRRGSLP
jgi:hypothetical protein